MLRLTYKRIPPAKIFFFHTNTVFPPFFNPLSANPTKWLKTLKQFIGNLPMNCLSVFGYFVKLALKGLITMLHLNISQKITLMKMTLLAWMRSLYFSFMRL